MEQLLIVGQALSVIEPSWAAPPCVHAFTTQRTGGVSQAPYDSLNLGTHVGDDSAAVLQNRSRLWTAVQLRSPSVADISWLNQVHGTCVAGPGTTVAEADALFTSSKGRVLAVMTADCLPVFIAAADGSEVAVAHAGWRGLAEGVLQATVERFSSKPSSLLAHLGPAIGPGAFEVGEDVRSVFLARAQAHEVAFQPARDRDGRRYWCDIYTLARQILMEHGISAISGGSECTFTQSERYFSYRRDGRTGRMASIIWLD